MIAASRGVVVALLVIVFGAAASAAASAEENDIAAVGRSITVAPGETRGDIACVHCTVYVRGTVKGDIAVFDGRIVVDGEVTGDIALFWGMVRLGDNSQVGGDIAVAGGELKKSPTASVHGQQVNFSRGQMVVGAVFAFVGLLVAIALIIWLIVVLFRRGRAPQQQVVRRV